MVEVGSWIGSSALVWCQKFTAVYCVDPGGGKLEKGASERREVFRIFNERTKDIKNIIPIRKTSVEASKDFEDDSLDFVYIDALHDYDSVKEDIRVWFPKVKKQGYIGGHDYGYPPIPDVKKAVDEIFGCIDIRDTEYSWMVKKDERNIIRI